MNTKEEITQCLNTLNELGCNLKIKYLNDKVRILIPKNKHFTGTEQQVLEVLLESKKTILDKINK